ncbi:MAG: TIM barrel protein [Puniceicoccales bacterium]|jgi:hydroxypyruvate isomerase|nr:TIM barrel protein [Puniceicoccales bacterium]
MNRRHALKTLVTTSALAALNALPASAKAAAASAKAPGTPSAGTTFRHAVCTGYGRMSVDKLAEVSKKLGIEGIDLVHPKDWETVKKHGLVCSLAWGPGSIGKGFNRRENHEKLVPDYIHRIQECAAAGVSKVICFSGNRNGQSAEQGLEICAEGIKKIAAAAEKSKVLVVMELLNSKVNHKGYLCDSSAWGVELVKRVGSEYFKLLYDIYHMQIMEGDIIRTIRANHQYFGHYHTAGNPGRNEFEAQDVQELNYAAIMKAIHGTGYRDFVAQEFAARRDPVTSLANAIKICTVPANG